MKTSEDAITVVYKILMNSPVKATITGDIYKTPKPVGSEKEDVVINSLSIDNNPLQQVPINVNVYVPALQINAEGQEQKVPDTKRLNELGKLVIAALNEHWDEDYDIAVHSQNVFQDPDTSEFYNNIRINFHFENF